MVARKATTARKVDSALTEAEEQALKVQTARAWRPQVNETVKGTLVKIVRREGDYGPYPCVILDTGDAEGYIAVHAFHGVLLNQLRDARPVAGDELTILYAGKRNSAAREGKKLSDYHGYALFVNGGDGGADWDYEADAEAAPVATPAPAKKAAPRKRAAAPAGAEDEAPGF